VDAKHSWGERVLVVVVLAMLAVGSIAVVATAWRLIPNHALALVAGFILVPLVLWGFTQDD
jgi:hypothetical protein